MRDNRFLVESGLEGAYEAAVVEEEEEFRMDCRWVNGSSEIVVSVC